MTGVATNCLSERKNSSLTISEVRRYRASEEETWPKHIKWSEGLKLNVRRNNLATFDEAKIVQALVRPFTTQWLYFDRILNERIYQWPQIKGKTIAVPGLGNRKPFGALMCDRIVPLDPAFEKTQCFPLSHLKDSALTQFRIHYSNPAITKEEIFHYIYALLHHPEYRTRYAANLKRELPRIPFAPDFQAFAAAGKELARLHVEYESLPRWPLEEIENKEVPFTQHVTKMKLDKDKKSLYVNESLTLAGIPPETFEFRLGSRSALEWIVDQYQVKGESDPNREDDPAYIIRLIGQVVRVSIETAAIVKTLPPFLA